MTDPAYLLADDPAARDHFAGQLRALAAALDPHAGAGAKMPGPEAGCSPPSTSPAAGVVANAAATADQCERDAAVERSTAHALEQLAQERHRTADQLARQADTIREAIAVVRHPAGHVPDEEPF